MAATTAGALKAYIEGLGLGISAFRDRAPPNRVPPYVTIMEAIAFVPDPREAIEPDMPSFQTAREKAQVDLWELWRATPAPGATQVSSELVTESYTLKPALLDALQGAQLVPIGSDKVYGVIVRNCVRLVEEDNNLVHNAITVDVFRQF